MKSFKIDADIRPKKIIHIEVIDDNWNDWSEESAHRLAKSVVEEGWTNSVIKIWFTEE